MLDRHAGLRALAEQACWPGRQTWTQAQPSTRCSQSCTCSPSMATPGTLPPGHRSLLGPRYMCHPTPSQLCLPSRPCLLPLTGLPSRKLRCRAARCAWKDFGGLGSGLHLNARPEPLQGRWPSKMTTSLRGPEEVQWQGDSWVEAVQTCTTAPDGFSCLSGRYMLARPNFHPCCRVAPYLWSQSKHLRPGQPQMPGWGLKPACLGLGSLQCSCQQPQMAVASGWMPIRAAWCQCTPAPQSHTQRYECQLLVPAKEQGDVCR